MMSIVNLHNPEQYTGGSSFRSAVNPEYALSLGNDVIDLSILQPEAFFNPPITGELASQPIYYQRIKMAWLGGDSNKLNKPLLDQKHQQTTRLIEYADRVDEAFKMETRDRYVLLYNPGAVLLPHEELGLFAVNSALMGSGKQSWHEQDSIGLITGETEMVPGGIVVINGNHTHSYNASIGTRPHIILAQLLPIKDSRSNPLFVL